MTQELSSVSISATQKTRANIGTFLNDFSEKYKQVENIEKEDIEPRLLSQIRNYIRQIHDEKRRDRIHKYICADSDKEGKFLESFVSTWFQALRLLDEDVGDKRFATMALIFRKVKICHLPVYVFVSIYNILVAEIEKCTTPELKDLVKFIDDSIGDDTNPTKRWRDCILLLLTKVKKTPRISSGTSTMDGKDFTENILNEWLIRSQHSAVFNHVVSIAISMDSKFIVEKFMTNYLLERIDEEEDKVLLTMKAICLLEIANEKQCDRILRALTTVWPFRENESSNNLLSCMELLSKTLSEHPTVSKVFMAFFKIQKGEVLSSSFAFCTLLCICGIERYKYTLFPIVKRTILKVWKFDDDVSDIGWVEACNCADYPDKVRKQIEHVVDLFVDEAWWKLLGTPVLCLAQSMLESSTSKEIIIVDGRVAGGPKIWLFAKEIMLKCLLSQQNAIETHLSYLLQYIASTSSLESALVLIDVLLEVVKRCSVEVLSNWKLLDGLFDYVCRMRRDVAISLIRCLLPIISNRSQLREALFRSLKKDLIDPNKVTAAVPILLLLLRSVCKRKTAAMKDGQLSQSFGSFSTQCLSQMGLKRGTDDSLSLEIVGILKRCLTQPTVTKIAFYDGVCEAASRTPSLVTPFLEMLIAHASTTPAWTPEAMVASSQDVTFLREPMPHLIQALELLMCETLAAANNENASQVNDVLINRVTQLLSTWVADAAIKDMTDLSLDKVAEWDPATKSGRQTLVFAHMMCSLYNMLIEHVWRRVAILNRPDDKDYLIAILNRRRELQDVLSEKTIKRKETKARSNDKKVELDLDQCQILTSADTISEMLNKTMEIEAETNELYVVKEDLLFWCVERACTLSKFLSQSHHPLHSMISNTSSLANIGFKLMTFYTGSDCVDWIREIPSFESSKTEAIIAYSNIVRYFCGKFTNYPERVTQLWQRPESEGSVGSSSENTGSGGINGILVRQVHLLMTKTYLSVVTLERGTDDPVDKKKHSGEFEKQAKAIINASSSILTVTSNRKTYNAAFKFLLRSLEKMSFSNATILRDLLKFVSYLAIQAADSDHLVSVSMCTLADDVIEHLSEEGDPQSYAFIDNFSNQAVCDFLITTTEKLLMSVKHVVVFASEFYTKDNAIDTLASHAITKCEECCDVVSRLLQLHTQFHVHKEKVAQALTFLYSSLDAPVEMLLNNAKIIPEMIEWECIDKLAALLKKKIHSIMAIADEKVGLLAPNEITSNNKKTQVAKAKRDETTYVKYVRTRETLQSRVLLLCRALKDERLNLQIRGNSIGIRDFRINQGIFEAKIAANKDEEENESEDSDEDNEKSQNPSKRARLSPESEAPQNETDADVTMPSDDEEEIAKEDGASDNDDLNMSKVY